MAWTSKQKQLAVRACRAAGLNEDQRTDVILRNFPNAHYGGDITSTSPKLNNGDFEHFMAIVERQAGGKLLHFTANYWQQHADDTHARMRHRVAKIAVALEAAGLLEPGGVGLGSWIEKRVSGGVTRDMEHLDAHGILALAIGLEAYATRNSVPFES